MAKLNGTDRNNLLKVLNELPALHTYRARRILLETAGLESIIPQIDLEGSSFIVNADIIHTLEVYGRVTFEHEALGVFLNAVKDFIGGADEKQTFINRLLQEYNLMLPVKTAAIETDWHTDFNKEQLLEKIIGENTLRPISFLQRGLEVSRAVALIDTGDWLGTGFMVSDNLMLTNNHVLPNSEVLGNTVFRFNYQLTFDGQEEKVKHYGAKQGGIFYTNEDLDFTFVEVEGTPGHDWGAVRINSSGTVKGKRVCIIQHPAGLPKQISFQNNIVQYVDDKVVQYLTSTLGGSSGSPVLDDAWQVVAVHHAGGMLNEPGSNLTYFRNEGIHISAVIKSIPEEIRNLLNK